jgi:hypothetical protein
MLRELAARKAKFGFDGGTFGLKNIVQVGKFIEALEVNHSGNYIAEAAGYNQPELRIYTDDEVVAQWIRDYKF